MSDPYQILGVSRSASEDEIKKAYRTLSRKYHPDANINNPNKDQAEARFKEVQQAYQQIIKERNSGYTNQQSYTNQQNYGNEENQRFQAAANYINHGYYQEALNVLKDIAERSARWYYYSALANAGRGNNVIALEHAKKAQQMEPGNLQYQQLVYQFEAGDTWYQSRRTAYGGAPVGGSSFCVRLCIANLVCNICCGGGGMCCGGVPFYC